RRHPWRALEAVLCLASGVAVQAYGIGKTGIPRRYGWYAPLGYAMCAAIMLNSTLPVVTGRGVEWRGRRYTGRIGTDRRNPAASEKSNAPGAFARSKGSQRERRARRSGLRVQA
nr:hypothetical protein [Candidatus Eremiobacteraeota bacterium]